MAYIYDIADTWAASGTVFTAIKMNVTDTASAAGSLLMDLQVGGTSRFKVDKNGSISLNSSSTGASIIGAFSTTSIALGTNLLTFNANTGNGVNTITMGGSGITVSPTLYYAFSSANFATTPDLFLFRDAANTLAQRNGVNAQAFNLYNTYTDASNYERGFMRFVSNTLQIGTDRLGTGSTRSLVLQTNGATRLTIGPTGTPEFTLAGALYINGQVGIAPVSAGVMRLTNYNADGFSTLQLGLATTGFPALKVSTSTLQVRLGNDSAFTNIQGKLTTEANAVSETITATHTITLYDAAGTAYKVPCVAA